MLFEHKATVILYYRSNLHIPFYFTKCFKLFTCMIHYLIEEGTLENHCEVTESALYLYPIPTYLSEMYNKELSDANIF